MATLQKGDRISNYLLEERAGAGSFGEVWRARHHVFDEVVAVKVPTDLQYVRNLQREGVAVHGLHHPNIVRAMDLDPYADPPYLVMEYVEGPSLREVIDRYRQSLPIDSAKAIMSGVLSALQAAHAGGLVHKDVKPANILLNCPIDKVASAREVDVKVTDFGLGQVGGVTTQSIMQSGSMETSQGRSVVGTLAYMSPEQKEGQNIDARSDLYACGIVLYEMLTGERPQGHSIPSSLRQEVPKALDDVFKQSYVRLDQRFASAADMLAAMRGSVSSPVPPPPPAAAWVPAGERQPCRSCGNTVERDDQFCIHCGEQLVVSVPRCPSCEAFVRSKDRFCIFCGNDLSVLSK